MPDNEEDKRPLGQKIRDFINPALADQRKNALQLDMLDKIFTQMADLMPKIFDKEFKSIFNHVSSRTKDKPELVAPQLACRWHRHTVPPLQIRPGRNVRPPRGIALQLARRVRRQSLGNAEQPSD